ncbi:DNA-3-methyladenine glycosylase I [Aestuariirhabdus litorea]|uniref:DNA-3-methyladenine glycosylase I n=1 Tax=Aestuariirhabdus litorea TaxID=2528527 RepID=A0A3P3VWF3_9GAMM|nr:DNA-3-methyladenine glycosylase I [Aestuariirhabdus litorea]RRJ85043.1 DNA-3-methyladenine glycosylase I [Aestuariirhabdus litorea]RWW98268.1 DNA-3-methyladenine glycosylase I [Endozoicomonadaceae bacterium GTF-13]
MTRCPWPTTELYLHYHDTEWGVPLHDDARLFEFLLLEGAQAGLSWITVLNKREAYRQLFDGFDPAAIARYSDARLVELQANPAIIRNRLKIESFRRNSRAYLDLVDKEGSFNHFIWQFTEHRVVQNRWQSMAEVPATTAASDAMSKDLKKRGFNFVGSTICYAYMQATGMVNDHLCSCFRHRELGGH